MQLVLHISVILCLLWSSTTAFFQSNVRQIPMRNPGVRNTSRLYLDIGSMIRNFGQKVKVSHILIGPPSGKLGRGMDQAQATIRLLQLKEEIDNDPDKFSEAAAEYSSCKSSYQKGGDLGEFGPGLMVKEFDKVCFEEEVGVVHGPISTYYGEHLILVRERTGGKN